MGKYSIIFGAPRTGIHSIRLFDIAIIDLILTMVLAYFIRLNEKYIYSLAIWLVIGLILHKLFDVQSS